MRHWMAIQPDMKVSAGYEFVEWAQALNPNNNEVLYKGYEWDTTEGKDHNEYKYEAGHGALIVTESLYTIKQLLNGKVTHVAISTGGNGILHAQGTVRKDILEKSEISSNQKLMDMYMSTHSIRSKFRP